MTCALYGAAEMALEKFLAGIGAEGASARLVTPPDPDLGDFATSCALQAAKTLRRAPMILAGEIADFMQILPEVEAATVARPGYVNIKLSTEFIEAKLAEQLQGNSCGITQADAPEKILLDFGGPNIKPMHVGHLRSLVLGEALRRILLAAGHDVVSDLHLGDWGLPSGMILAELRRRDPGAPWFTPQEHLSYPTILPITLADLGLIYPLAAAACKQDPARMGEARAVTAALQGGDPGLSALWALIVGMAKEGILTTCERVGAHFDLTLGESDAQEDIPEVFSALHKADLAHQEGEAVVLDLSGPDATCTLPPLVVAKGDGSALYATTDLGTLLARRRDLGVDRVLYVVDGRQELHFRQVFRAAHLSGISGGAVLEHIAFGTVNGPDGKPYRTRSGGVMGLEALLDTAQAAARDRLLADGRFDGAAEAWLQETSDLIGIAALRVADLSAHREGGYVLDLQRAVSFEGKTGPYLLYALVRLRSILAKAESAKGDLLLRTPEERRLALRCLSFGRAVQKAVDDRAPHEVTNWAFALAADVGRFYAACPVIHEGDPATRASRLSLCAAAEQVLAKALFLLGCRVPNAM